MKARAPMFFLFGSALVVFGMMLLVFGMMLLQPKPTESALSVECDSTPPSGYQIEVPPALQALSPDVSTVREEVPLEPTTSEDSDGIDASEFAAELATLRQALVQEQERNHYLLNLLANLIQDSTDLRGSPLSISERYLLEAAKRGCPVSAQDPFVGFLDGLEGRLHRLDISLDRKRNVREQVSYDWCQKLRTIVDETERKLGPLRDIRSAGSPTQSADAQSQIATLIRERENSLRYLLPQELWAD